MQDVYKACFRVHTRDWPGSIIVENNIVIKFYFFNYNAIIIFTFLYVKEGIILSVLS
jgi:hypothetical protein